MTNTRRGTALLVAAALIGTVLTGCSAPESSALKIALLLPESRTARYEAFDRPFFEERIHELGDYTVLYSNADQDAAHDTEFFRVNALLLRNTSVVNMVDGCALSLPCHTPDELPVGLMVWHGAGRDDTVLNLSLRIEEILQIQ